MRALKLAWSGIVGLFVDDTGFAAAILAWLALCWLGLPRLSLPSAALPPAILFAGLAAILVGSAVRRARPGR